jgi:hypothetical protein
MSFLYPRTISITRPNSGLAPGYVADYSGVEPSDETDIADGVPASIQLKKTSGRPDANLPADAGKTLWTVLIPLGYAPLGLIQTNDIITDDLSQRYQVVAPYWNSLGFALLAERLEP